VPASLIFPIGGSLLHSLAGSASASPISGPAQRSIITACKLAESLNDPLHRRLRRSRHLLRRYNCYRPERPLPGGTIPHWETAPLRGALSKNPKQRYRAGYITQFSAKLVRTVRSVRCANSAAPCHLDGLVSLAWIGAIGRIANDLVHRERFKRLIVMCAVASNG
jgi:hypothetical protein